MTALADNKPYSMKNPGTLRSHIQAPSTTIWAGSLVCLDANGKAVPASATAGLSSVAGVAIEKVVSDGSTEARIRVQEGDLLVSASSITQAMTGRSLYVVDDNNVDDRATTKIFAGRLLQFVSTTQGYMKVGADVPKPKFVTILEQALTLSGIANGDVVTNFTPGFAGRIMSAFLVIDVPVTTAAKAATFNLEIGSPGTDVTGGVIALTSANATPRGAVIAGTAITALDDFTETDVISVEASSVTAFVEGTATLHIIAEEY